MKLLLSLYIVFLFCFSVFGQNSDFVSAKLILNNGEVVANRASQNEGVKVFQDISPPPSTPHSSNGKVRFQFGAMVGAVNSNFQFINEEFNLSRIDFSSSTSFTGEVFLNMYLTERFALRGGVGFFQSKGEGEEKTYAPDDPFAVFNDTASIAFSHIQFFIGGQGNIPLNGGYLTLFAGGTFGFSSLNDFELISSSANYQFGLQKRQMGLKAGVGFEKPINENISFLTDYSFGVSSNNISNTLRTFRTIAHSLRVGIAF